MTEPEPTATPTPSTPPADAFAGKQIGEPVVAPTPPPAAVREPGGTTGLLRVGLVLLTPLIALAVIAARPRRFDLWVDNGGDAPVVVEVQGRSQELPPRSTFLLEGLRGGRVELGWREGGAERREQVEVEAEPFSGRASWVWNVGDRTPRYWVVSRSYGTAVAPPPRPMDGPCKGVWRLPDELLGLDQALPEQVNSRGAPGAVRSVAWSEHHLASLAPPRLILHVDPGVTVPVRLAIDGRDVGTIPPGARFRSEDLAPGRHLLEATVVDANGNPGQSARIEADLSAEPLAPPAGWVWMPFQQRELWIVAHALGEVPGPLPRNRRFEPPAALFRIPAGIEPGLDELPLGARVPRDAKGAVVLGLWTQAGLRNAIVELPPLDPNQFDLKEKPGQAPPMGGWGGG